MADKYPNLDHDAEVIATIIRDAPIEYRGELLTKAASYLDRYSQYYTAQLLKSAGHEYGVGGD